ncbi:hypothetical protein AAEP93_008373, partial [Penicillium crustosum]
KNRVPTLYRSWGYVYSRAAATDADASLGSVAFEDDEQDPDSITFVSKAADTYQPFTDHGAVVSALKQSNNTSSLIIDEINTNTHLSVARTGVLRSALDIVKRFISSSQHADSIPDEKITPDPASKLIDFRIELFYMMMGGQNERDALALHWPDHISPLTLQRMCLALMSGTVGRQTDLQYKLCVLYKATIFVSRWLRFSSPGGLSDCLAKSRKQYTAAFLESLSMIDFSRSPSLAMLQALLSGVGDPQSLCRYVVNLYQATLVQLLGDTTRSWHLTALASRVVVALGYHTSTSIGCDADEEIEIRRCLSWCYYMDKTLSMLLVRPTSLPVLASDPVDLLNTVSENPLSYKVRILVKLAQVQDISLSLMLKGQKEELAMAQEPALLEDLQNRLKSISEEIRQSRQKFAEQPAAMIEWDAIDFTFFSIATSVLRLKSLAVQNNSRRQECLRYARRALFSMQACQKHISVLPNLTTDFLFWTALLYPLTPLFVVFCNVVATSDIEDLELLKDVTSTISRIKDQCTFGSNLYRLLSELIKLCSNLHDIQPSQPPHNHHVQSQGSPTGVSSIVGKINRTIESEVAMLNFTEGDANSRWHVQQRTQQSDCHRSCEGPKRSSIWDEGLMRELFNTHPSVEWLDYHSSDFQETTHP